MSDSYEKMKKLCELALAVRLAVLDVQQILENRGAVFDVPAVVLKQEIKSQMGSENQDLILKSISNEPLAVTTNSTISFPSLKLFSRISLEHEKTKEIERDIVKKIIESPHLVEGVRGIPFSSESILYALKKCPKLACCFDLLDLTNQEWTELIRKHVELVEFCPYCEFTPIQLRSLVFNYPHLIDRMDTTIFRKKDWRHLLKKHPHFKYYVNIKQYPKFALSEMDKK